MQNILDGYSFFYKAPSACKAGGIGIFVKNVLEPKLKISISDIEKNNINFEHIWIEISISSKKYCIGGFYRHPNTPVPSLTDALSRILQKLNKNRNCFILADMNIDLSKYEKDLNTKLYVDLLCSYNFIPYSFLPTRITCSSATIIDHLFSNCQVISPISVKSGLVTCDISDHLGNFMLVNTEMNKNFKERPYIRIYSSKNIASFTEDLNKTNWNGVFTASCVNAAFDQFSKLYADLFNKHFPLIKQSRKKFKHKNWISKCLQISIHHKNSLYKRWLMTKTPSDEIIYKTYAKKLKYLLNKARSDHYKKLLDTKLISSKGIWKCLNDLSCNNRKSNTSHKLSKVVHNNQAYTSDPTIADAFNNYFVDIPEDLRKSLPAVNKSFKNYLKTPVCNSFYCRDTTPTEIIDVISKIKSSGSSGPDNIPSSIIKSSKHAIANVFAYLCNYSFNQGVFPHCLKSSKVIPLFKNGYRKLIASYRPISLLYVFSKILEKCMCNRLK